MVVGSKSLGIGHTLVIKSARKSIGGGVALVKKRATALLITSPKESGGMLV
jgi:hypothetical protein